jgi:MFS family permease
MWRAGTQAHAVGMLITASTRIPGGRPFRLLLTSLAVSSCGDWLYNVALIAFVFERTGSPTWVALTTAARVLPMVVLGPFGGAFADRYDRRALIVGSDLARAGLMVGLAAVAGLGLPIALAPLLAGLATAAGTVQPPCVAACTARFVPEADRGAANALRSAVGQVSIVAGPALGALILLLSGPALAILLNALTFLASAAAISAIAPGPAFQPARHDGAGAELPSLLADVRSGAEALRGAGTALRLISADILCSTVYGLLTVTLVLVGRQVGAGVGGYGLLLGACGIGGLLGAVLAGRFATPARWRPTLTVALLAVGVGLAALGSVGGLASAVALAGLAGAGMIVGEVLSETALPQMLDDEILARAYGLVLPVNVVGIVAGSLIGGPLVALLGLQGALVAAGAAVLVVGGLLLRRPLASRPLTVVAPASI